MRPPPPPEDFESMLGQFGRRGGARRQGTEADTADADGRLAVAAAALAAAAAPPDGSAPPRVAAATNQLLAGGRDDWHPAGCFPHNLVDVVLRKLQPRARGERAQHGGARGGGARGEAPTRTA